CLRAFALAPADERQGDGKRVVERSRPWASGARNSWRAVLEGRADGLHGLRRGSRAPCVKPGRRPGRTRGLARDTIRPVRPRKPRAGGRGPGPPGTSTSFSRNETRDQNGRGHPAIAPEPGHVLRRMDSIRLALPL